MAEDIDSNRSSGFSRRVVSCRVPFKSSRVEVGKIFGARGRETGIAAVDRPKASGARGTEPLPDSGRLPTGNHRLRGTVLSGLRGSMTTPKLRALVPVMVTLLLGVCTRAQTVSPTTTKATGVVAARAGLSSLERQELAVANQAWAGVGRSRFPSLVGSAVRFSGNGFVNADAKIAFVLGRVTPPSRFPTSPVRDGRWVVISAQQAFHLLAPPVRGTYVGPPDRVLSVHLGTDVWATARGGKLLPTWLFTVSGLKGTVSVLALSPSDLYHPRQVSDPRPGSSVLVGSASLRDGGRIVTLGFVGGPVGRKDCDDSYKARVVQERAIVVVFVTETRVMPSGVFCAQPGYRDHLSVKLSQPIGGRILVDGASASAVPF